MKYFVPSQKYYVRKKSPSTNFNTENEQTNQGSVRIFRQDTGTADSEKCYQKDLLNLVT